MIYPDVKFGAFPKESVIPDEKELMARLEVKNGYHIESLSEIIKCLTNVLSFRYAYTLVPVSVYDNICDFGISCCESQDLSLLLKDCNEAFFLAVTAGIGVDRLISSRSAVSKAEAFIIDSAASAVVESFCNIINKKICYGLDTTKRFSPGYGDVPLSFQKSLLQRLNSPSSVGITLNSSLLMTPMKSITAIIGIKNRKENGSYGKA